MMTMMTRVTKRSSCSIEHHDNYKITITMTIIMAIMIMIKLTMKMIMTLTTRVTERSGNSVVHHDTHHGNNDHDNDHDNDTDDQGDGEVRQQRRLHLHPRVPGKSPQSSSILMINQHHHCHRDHLLGVRAAAEGLPGGGAGDRQHGSRHQGVRVQEWILAQVVIMIFIVIMMISFVNDDFTATKR